MNIQEILDLAGLDSSNNLNDYVIDPADVTIVVDPASDIVITPSEEGVICRLPTQEEVTAMMEENDRQEALQNQTHGNTCSKCQKFSKDTPNPRSKMGRCKWNNVMVMEFQTSCGEFVKSNKRESAWEPEI